LGEKTGGFLMWIVDAALGFLKKQKKKEENNFNPDVVVNPLVHGIQ
jgi:hypothetical protein